MAGKPTYEELERRVKELKKEVAEYNQAEKSLKEREAVVEALFSAISDSAFLIDLKGNIISLNDMAAKGLGKNRDGVLGKCIFDLFPPHVAKVRQERIAQVIRSGKTIRFEDERSGIWFDNIVNPVFDAQGEVSQLAVFERDITDLKRAGEALRTSETRFRNIIEKNADGIIILDMKGIVRFANPAAEALLDRKGEELVGEMFGYPSVEGGTPEIKIMHSNGEMMTAEMRAVKVTWNGEDAYIASLRDISERKRAEEELNLLATAIEQAAESIVITDKEGIIQYVNPAFERITGYTREEAVGQNPSILKSGKHNYEFYKEMWDTLKSLKVWTGHFINRKKDGHLYQEEASISPIQDSHGKIINYVAVKRDVTDEIRLERQLRQSQKMEAIGTLAGGIAHDFNNILSGIMGYTELVDLDVPQGSPAKENLEEVLKATNRAKDLVKQILAFSRHSEQERKPVQIGLIAKEALKFLKASLPPSIEIRQHIESETAIVEADPTQIHQVLINLCTNAADAMRQRRGVLEVRLTKVNLDETDGGKYTDLPSGHYVRLSVSDTGHGMTSDVLERIFDPYFTTKEKGKGTGLGLAVVHRIVKNHGGIITAYSEPGKGSIFNVYIPRIEREVREELEQAEPLPTGYECILFVDDERTQVDMGKQMLKRLGYKVNIRTSGMGALKLFRAQPNRFDLVITDKIMPGMTGEQLAKKLILLSPDIPIILCTGFSAMIEEENAKAVGIKEVVMKPIVMREMACTIRRVLDEGMKKDD